MKKIACVVLIGLLVFSCKKATNVPLSFDYGSIKDGVYDNTFFKFKFPVNTNWYVLNNEEANQLYEVGNDVAAGDKEALKKTLEASAINMAKLFSAFKYKPGANTDFNPSLLVNAENLKDAPEVDTPEKYLIEAKKILNETAMDIEYVEEKHKVKIGSQNFEFIKLKNKGYGYDITQDYYVTVKRGFAISFIMSYTTEADKETVYKMFDKLKI